ncbi:unnamed protein product [Phyllotreta striolata]|uniref:RNA helicase n=1 Tax=Phyllotreta striolata TaxID=444603 RepID=A0A9N9XQ49_PHYSR|nr:unnamed protein product [Phyllotreta striolata]
MDLTGQNPIELTTFVNPHLFWFILKTDARSEQLNNLNKQFQKFDTFKNSNDSFEIGEIVATKISEKFYRAVIEHVEFENDKLCSYLLWLIDFGLMRESNDVFKLPSSLRKFPPLAIQAALNNAVYIQKVIEYNEFGQPCSLNKHYLNPNPRCRNECYQWLSKTCSLTGLNFKFEKKEEGIAFGDIVLNDNAVSLRDHLTKIGSMAVDEELFKGLPEFICNYKENHLWSIFKICKQEPYLLDKENRNKLEDTCSKIVSKVLDEFNHSDLLNIEDEMSEHLWRSNRSRTDDTLTSIESTTSDNETPIKIKTKKEKMMEKLRRRNKPQLPDVPEKKPIDAPEPAKSSKKIIFCAAGSERSFNKSKKPTTPRRDTQHSSRQSPNPSKNSTGPEQSSSEANRCTSQTENEEKSSMSSSSEHHENLHSDSPSVGKIKLKPYCSCKQCRVWTQEDNVFIEKFPERRKTEKIVGRNDQFLFRDSNAASNVKICSLDYASMTKMKKQMMMKLLVHSESYVSPVQQMTTIAFHENILNSLKKHEYKEPKRIQKYAWPAILRNQHVFMISGPQTGKTMAYLPVVCTFLMEKRERYSSLLKVAGGPIVTIICSNTSKCEEVFDLTRIIFGNLKLNVALVTYPLAHVNTSHTDMLITTPSILIDLLKNRSINFKRLCHLVLENGDELLRDHSEAMNSIFDLVQSMLKNRVFTKALQLVVCAEHWNYQLKSLAGKLQQIPMICIGHYLEAALYGNLEFSMKFSNSSCKLQELKNLLKDTYKTNKSIVICKEEDIEEIHDILSLKGIISIPVYANLSQEEINSYEEGWTEAKEGAFSVLISNDSTVDTLLNITCATTLIHYSLPKSWSKFVKRFSCLLENCSSPLENKPRKTVSKSIVLCDESCKEQMFKFFNFINSTDLKKQLPEKIQRFSDSLKRTEEEQKLEKGISLCGNLKLFGKCTKMNCSRRHLIAENSDVSDDLPKSGKIKFKIVDVADVTTFSIQLLQHVDNDSKVYEREEFDNVTEELTATLRLGRKIMYNPVIGHHYSFYNSDEQGELYHRCEVLDIKNDCIRIKLLDKGSIVNTTTSRIYRLPKEFETDVKPRATIDAILANYVPPYNDENFSAKSFYNLKTLLEEHNYKNIIFTAEVHLQLNQTLWLKDVHEEVILSDKIIPGFQLSREILTKKLAQHDLGQLIYLHQLCKDANIVLPDYEKPKVQYSVKKEEKNYQWAYLDNDEINEVTFSSAFSPEEIYVRLNKFSDLLYTLQKEIQESIKRPNYPKLQNVNVGEVYLAKDSVSQEYCRVLVVKKELEQVLCFFLDFGDETVLPMNELKYILPIFISKLPFQCIQCRLHGVKSLSEEWEQEATNVLYDYSTEPHTDIFRLLYAKVCKKENPTTGRGNKYSILLKDGFGEKKSLLNQLLIDCGLVAVEEMEELNDFEIPVQEYESSEPDEEYTKINEILTTTKNLCNHLHKDEAEEHEPKIDDLEMFTYGDPMDFFSQLMRRNEPPIQSNRELPAITAVPAVDYYTPDIVWSQDDDTIKLHIKLVDVKDYTLNIVKGRILNFRTLKDNKTYSVKFLLYEIIESCQDTLFGHGIKVTLKKIKKIEWPRLTLSHKKYKNITYDLQTLCENEEEKNVLLQLPKDLDIEDDDELGEDEPMYVVESDLDSDLDVELPMDFF